MLSNFAFKLKLRRYTAGVHVFYAIIDGGVDKDDGGDDKKLSPAAIAQTYWDIAAQPKSCWTFELDVRPSVETW